MSTVSSWVSAVSMARLPARQTRSGQDRQEQRYRDRNQRDSRRQDSFEAPGGTKMQQKPVRVRGEPSERIAPTGYADQTCH